jgi:gliding motility-associated-like protein
MIKHILSSERYWASCKEGGRLKANRSKLLWIGRVFVCLLLIYLPSKMLAQDFSNRGTDFWVGYMGHIDGAGSNFKLYITSDVNTSGTVSVPLQGWSMPFTVVANTITIVQVPSATAYIGCSDCLEQKGIHVVSNDKVAAYAHIYASARSDATLMLPTAALGKEYYTMCFTQAGGYKSEFLVVATEDSTIVQITPKANTTGGNLANVPFVVTLQQGEAYQVQSSIDLTGSKVLAYSNDSSLCKKVAVFSGSTWNSLGCSGAGSGDNLYEEMYPVNTWGKNFITSPLKSRVGDTFRVMAGTNGTTVSINGVAVSLNQTQYFDTLLFVPAFVTADKPIMLAQYARTANCDNQVGDPFMIILSPLEQTINNVLLYSSPEQNITGQYINIVMKTADVGSCLLDGVAAPFIPVPFKPDYSYSQNTVTDGTHTIIADSGFNAIVYGFGSPESYGYLAGTNIRNLEDQSFTVNPLPACNGSTITFTGTATYVPSSWKWDFGDSTTSILQNPTHIYADTGTYLVLLVTAYPNGCEVKLDSTTYSLHIFGNAIVDFTAPSVCLGDFMPLNDISTTINGGNLSYWHWDFGDGDTAALQNTGHTYITCDTFNVKLVVTSDDGCRDSTTKAVIVNCLPVPNFNAIPVCKNQAMIFTDSSTGTISAWNWDFGDNSAINTSSNPSYTYANSGIYNVTLTVTTTDGCTDSITKPVQIYYNPVAGFTHTDVCLGDTMYFNNTSSVDNSSSIASYLWVFGDNSTSSTIQNPNHYYSLPGTYSVTLVTTTIDGCSNASNIQVKTFDAPGSAFTFSNTCLLDSAQFTNTTSNPTMGNTATWSWDFGDASPLNTSAWNLSHIYSSPGNYQVTLITYSSNLGCSDTLKDSITVFPMPVADFSFNNVCLNVVMNFYDSSSILSGSIASWTWDFGDASPLATVQNPSHTYSNPGTYIVSLISTSNNNCYDTITKSVVVHPLPDAQYSALNVCDGSDVQFNDLSNILPTDSIQSWTWDFGDGSPISNNQNNSHLFSAAGSYTIELLIISNFGCLDSISKISVVNPNPLVSFTASDTIGCEPLCISYQNSSFISTGNNVTWLWNLGDGSPTSNSQDLFHCYTNQSVYLPISYSPTLTITSDSGCVSVLSKNNYITVYPLPDAGFTVQPQTATIVDPVVSITHLTTGGNYWNWNFGDSDTSSVFNPAPHTYADTGTYTIMLITSTQYNCIDTAYQTVIVEPNFLFYIPNVFTPDGDGINDSFSGKGIFITEFEMTIFDRWGSLIYKSIDMNKPWDGKANKGAEEAQTDVYIYNFKITDHKMNKHDFKGIVTLLR